MKLKLLLFFLAFSLPALLFAQVEPIKDHHLKMVNGVQELNHDRGEPFYQFYPYVPRKTEYNIELGSMWEKNTMYWVGLGAGWNVGTCILSNSQTCQQYIDLTAGVGGRDGYTNGVLMPSLRWQFVSFPKTYSTSARVFAGVMNLNDELRRKENVVYGVGYGISRTVHKNIDLKIEFRVGGGDATWSQVYLSFGLKLGAFVNYFAKKMGGLGVGAVKSTGKLLKKSGELGIKAIKKTGEASMDAVKKTGTVTGGALKKAGKASVKAIKKTGEVTGKAIKKAGESTGIVDESKKDTPKK